MSKHLVIVGRENSLLTGSITSGRASMGGGGGGGRQLDICQDRLGRKKGRLGETGTEHKHEREDKTL